MRNVSLEKGNFCLIGRRRRTIEEPGRRKLSQDVLEESLLAFLQCE
jgi:hypothetical protein